MSDTNRVTIPQAISWVVSVAVFFAGVTFALVGRTNENLISDTAEDVRIHDERIRKLETVVEVQQVQYLNIMAAIAELKIAIKEHTSK